MQLIRRGFYTGMGRSRQLLIEANEHAESEKQFFISDTLLSDDIQWIIYKDKLEHLWNDNCIALLPNLNDNVIQKIIYDTKNVKELYLKDHVGLYIHGNVDIDLRIFDGLDNLKIYEFYQLGMESKN